MGRSQSPAPASSLPDNEKGWTCSRNPTSDLRGSLNTAGIPTTSPRYCPQRSLDSSLLTCLSGEDLLGCRPLSATSVLLAWLLTAESWGGRGVTALPPGLGGAPAVTCQDIKATGQAATAI